MAKGTKQITTSINNAGNKIQQSVNNAANTNSQAIDNLTTSVNSAIQELGDGIKLTLKSSKEDNDKRENDLKKELDGLHVFCPEIAEQLEQLIAINTDLTAESLAQSEEQSDLIENLTGEDSEDENSEDVKIKTDAVEVNELSGLTKITEITGTGFAIVGNLLKNMSDLFATVLGANGELMQEFMANMNQVGGRKVEEAAQEKSKSTGEKDGTVGKSKLANFFEGLAGPLNSIASGVLLLSTAMLILTTIQLNAELMGQMIAFGTFMFILFGTMSMIRSVYLEQEELIDTEGENKGSITQIVKDFALMIAMTVGSLLIAKIAFEIFKENFSQILLGLVVIFGTAFVTLVTLNATAALMGKFVGKDSDISKTIKNFATLVLTLVGLALICTYFWSEIQQGLVNAQHIIGLTLAVMVGIGITMLIVSKAGVTSEQMNAFSKLIMTATILIGVVAILAVILGALPQEWINTGIMNVTRIIILVDSVLLLLVLGIKALEKVQVEKIQAFLVILIVTTVMIALISVLVIVLGLLPVEVITQGIIAMTFIAGIPILMIKLLANVGKQQAHLAQALLGTVIAGIITLAVAAIAFLIIATFSGFTLEQVLTAGVAVLATTALLLIVGAATYVLAGLFAGGALAIASLMALGAIAITGVISIAVAGVAVLLAETISVEQATRALAAVFAIVVTIGALIHIAGSVVLLAVWSKPLSLAADLAMIAIQALSVFLVRFAVEMVATLTMVSEVFATLDNNALKKALKVIVTTISQLILLSIALAAFNLVGLALVVNVYLATALLVTLNVEMTLFAVSYLGLTTILENLPQTEINLEPVNNCINQLSKFSAVVNRFTTPKLSQLLAVSVAMGFVANFTKKLGKIGTDDTVQRVTNLANSLAMLASQSTGLIQLSGAIKSVANATKELDDLPSKLNTGNLEALTGQLNVQAELSQIEKPKEKDNSTEIGQKFDKMIELLSKLTDSMNGVRESVAALAQQQSLNATYSNSDSKEPLQYTDEI